ncbi:MAG: LPS assembly lipoprotein LptE [Casimicrobium sp.]
MWWSKHCRREQGEAPHGYAMSSAASKHGRIHRDASLALSMTIALLAAALLSACGFQLRGTATYPFASVYVQRPTYFGVTTSNLAGTAAPVVPDVIVSLMTNGIAIKEKIEDADFAIRFLQVFFDKRVLSLSGGGRAREFELEYRVRYEFVDAKGRAWGEPGEITIRRDFSFSESQALAKEAEETQLIRDMQLDAAAQILRRLQAVKRPA